MEGNSNETLLETPNPPQKKLRLWKKGPPPVPEDEGWYIRMSQIREKHLVQAIYDNAMNCVLEGTRRVRRGSLEDEAVTMAIKRHGLSYSPGQLNPNAEGSWQPENASTSAVVPHSSSSEDIPSLAVTNDAVVPITSSTEDVLSHAVTAAIRKKGLGAADR